MGLIDPHASLHLWPDKLQQVQHDQLSAQHFGEWAREQQTLLAALPPKYEQVLLNLLDRLESSALFTDESCSFSQSDLLDSLQQWADKAQQSLDAQAVR